MSWTRSRLGRRRAPAAEGAVALTLLGVVAVLLLCTGATARRSSDTIQRVVPSYPQTNDPARPAARLETLWIFDADFEDLLGDNAGWTSYDCSGTIAQANYWHKDTIRINGFTYLGDSTWWCGKYDDCWRQPRGYGNNWLCILSRSFPEVTAACEPGDILVLEYDQRFAIEAHYDYGYTDISEDGGATWSTVTHVTNPGFPGTPGPSQDWDGTNPMYAGHQVKDLSEFSGGDIALRFRFESDCMYSSQDHWNNPPFNSCLDGAWQLDNISWYVNGELLWLDDCESPGNNGWLRDDLPASGQTGVTFSRGVYGTDFWTGRAFSCDERAGWMYAAVDPYTSTMVDGQYAWLMSPPIDISGAANLVFQWDAWVDFPRTSGDIFNLYVAATDQEECVLRSDGFVEESPGWWYGGPRWDTRTDSWDDLVGNQWLAMMWAVLSEMVPPPEEGHMGGLFLNRQRVGVVSGELETRWTYGERGLYWPEWADGRFNDWFWEQLYDASFDSAYVEIDDEDGIASAFVVASNDSGATWNAYPMVHSDYPPDVWIGPPPANQMTAGSEILYYFEATDSLGNVSTYPNEAPNDCFEFSILPLRATVTEPGILIVDKHNAMTPGEDRAFGRSSEYYYREMLEVLGYECEVFDVEFPGHSGAGSWGPDSVGMKYYDTQIWITSDSREPTLKPVDQASIIAWLAQASGGKERNLFLSGNNIGYDMTVAGAETLGFYSTWLVSEFVSDAAGEITVDSLPALRDHPAGFDFMTYDDGSCILRGGCPSLGYFDVIRPSRAVAGVETALEYVRSDMTSLPAGVAYTDSTGYQTVTLGFGIEFMSHALLPYGHFTPGVSDRVDLMSNIMEYFGKAPTGPPTGVEDGEVFINRLDHARPNPFNPKTAIAYSIATDAHVLLRVFDAAGRLVRTLVDSQAEAGPHTVAWDGTTDAGDRAASGVYFVRMEAAGTFREARKVVLLK